MKHIKQSLLWYLNWYHDNIQDSIMLVSRPTLKNSWANRALFLSEDYIPTLHYNHRSIMNNEVVIEYDLDDKELNKKLAYKVTDKFKKEGIKYSIWFSGNKSCHVHLFIDPKEARNISLLKNVFMRHYGTFYLDNKTDTIYRERHKDTDIKILPDIRLCAPNHLIRAEYGIHEKTSKIKYLLSKSREFPYINKISSDVWNRYIRTQQIVIKRRVSTDAGKITDLPGFKYIASSHNFRKQEDGRERAMFVMIHALKDQYKDRKDDFIKYIQDWYRYSGGYKLGDNNIKFKVIYHWNRTYKLENFLNELLESIGMEDLINN